MRLIRTTRLQRAQKQHIVHCEIDLCQLPGAADAYLVNLRQGRAGHIWRDSTRTTQPVSLDVAEALFAKALDERLAQGFIDPSLPAAPLAAPAAAHPVDQVQQQADAVLLARLAPAAWKALDAQARTRTIWRLGERRLGAAVPALVGMIEQGKPMQDYCIAWAIGRCGDAGAAHAMLELHRRGKTDAVRRIALQAWLTLASPEALQAHAQRLVDDWPARLRQAWAAQDEAAFAHLGADPAQWTTLPLQDWLEQLDQVALVQPLARTILLKQLGSIAFGSGTFRAVRHLYKAAELRADAALWGLLQQRFDTTPACRRDYVWGSPARNEAYLDATRDYLRRRGWRTLRRLGEAGDAAYVEMAVGALLAMHDADAGKPCRRGKRHYGPYSHWMLLNRLLHERGNWQSNRTGRSWHQAQATQAGAIQAGSMQAGALQASGGRTEAFPALWDARPDALMMLLGRSDCQAVHQFAVRALADNGDYCAALPMTTLRALLRSPYSETARFAFELCRTRIGSGAPDTRWLMLLLQSNLPEALQYVIDAVGQEPERFWGDPILVAALACAPDARIRRLGRLLCQCALGQSGQAEAIMLQVLDWLDNCSDVDEVETTVAAITADLLWLIDHPLRAPAASAPYERLLALAGHALPSVRLLAGEWLLRHALAPSQIPPAILGALLQDQDSAVRSMGVRLFGALPEHILAAQPALFASFCTHADAGVRRAIDGALRRVVAAYPALSETLLPILLDALFRAESSDGLHADLLAWMAGPFKDAAPLAERALLVRLLASRSKGAQQLGGMLLPGVDPLSFSVEDWASLGRNENVSVRQWACAAYSAHPERIRAHMEQALRLFDTRWDDSRQFACTFFANQCSSTDWTAALLVSLCDHPDATVQRFGQHMLSTHFEVGDITDFIFKLGQHPSPNMQLFVSAWLESAAAGDCAKLARLEPYFLSVLSQVHRGRVAKNRALAFLRNQATLGEEMAALVARIFARQVLTVAIADKAQYIEGLRAIQAQYPGLPAHLSIARPRALASRREPA